MPLHKYLTPGENPYPHMGQLLAKVLRQKGWSQAHLCTALGVSDTGVYAYIKNPSLQAGILWKAGLALKYNFFADLAAAFPYPPETENPLQKRMEVLERKAEDLERELEIYKRIVHNKP